MRWLAPLGFLVGCSGSDTGDGTTDSGTDGGACGGDLAVVPGTGATGFVQLNPGDPVTMVHGPQGGWHVETAGFVTSSLQNVAVAPTLFASSLAMQIAGDQQDQFIALAQYSAEGCSGQFSGVRAFVDDVDSSTLGLDYQQFICSLEGQTLELTIAIEDVGSGTSATATQTVTAQLDTADVGACN